MKKKLGVIFSLLLLTGCNRYTEVNELSIVEVISIEKKQEITESVSLVIPKKEKNSYHVLTSSGTSLGNAFIHLQNLEEKKIYFDQAQILLLDTTLLKEEIDNLIPFLLKNFHHPNWLTFLCDDCQAILKQEKTKSFYENLIRKEQNRSGNLSITTFEDFASFYLEEGISAYLPFLTISDGNVQVDKLAIFKNDKTLTFLKNEEAKIFFLLKEKGRNYEENIQIGNKSFSYSLFDVDCKISLKNDKVILNVSGFYKSNDGEENSNKNVQEKLQKQLLNEIQSFLIKDKSEKTDLLGIYHLFFRNERNEKVALQKMQNAHYQVKISLKKEGALN